MEETDRVGKKVRLILVGNRFYSGIILDEDQFFIILKDKFGERVTLGKNSIISMEEI